MEKDTLEQELKTLICNELNRIRKEQNITIEQMSEQTSLDYTSLFRICSGRYVPKLTSLIKICQAYNIPLSYFFRDVDKLPDKEKTELQKQASEASILRSFYKLDENLRNAILELIRGYNSKKHK